MITSEQLYKAEIIIEKFLTSLEIEMLLLPRALATVAAYIWRSTLGLKLPESKNHFTESLPKEPDLRQFRINKHNIRLKEGCTKVQEKRSCRTKFPRFTEN
jgi:hypothetical protein